MVICLAFIGNFHLSLASEFIFLCFSSSSQLIAYFYNQSQPQGTLARIKSKARGVDRENKNAFYLLSFVSITAMSICELRVEFDHFMSAWKEIREKSSIIHLLKDLF